MNPVTMNPAATSPLTMDPLATHYDTHTDDDGYESFVPQRDNSRYKIVIGSTNIGSGSTNNRGGRRRSIKRRRSMKKRKAKRRKTNKKH